MALKSDPVTPVALGEARGAGGFALNRTRPACSVRENSVGVKLRGDGCAGDGERVARGGAGGSPSRGVWVEDRHGSAIWTIGGRSCVAKLINEGGHAAKRIVACTGRR